jgi:hypothetical protein
MTMPSSESISSPSELDNSTPVDEKRLLSWVLDQHKRCKADRSVVERQWYMNLAFYFGRQNVRMTTTAASSTGFRLITPPAPPWRVRLVVNKVRPMVRVMLAKTTSQKPKFTVVPATTEDNDVSAARVAEQVFNHVYAAKNVKRVIRRAEWWTIICGTSFIKDYWDPNAIDKSAMQKGDIQVEHISPFHLFVPDLLEEELENQPYVIHQTMKSLDWVERAYGKKVARQANVKATNDILEDSFLNMVGASTSTAKDQVLVLEAWIKPGNKYLPNGGLVTIVGEQIVQLTKQYPYIHGEFPFSKLDFIETGKFYGESVITDIIPLQREYNRTRSQIIEAKNLMGKPKYLAQKGSMNPNQITSEPGQVIFYTPGFNEPKEMQHAPLPNHVLQEVQQLQEDIDDISGQHDISRGKNPSQVTAATALSFLQEQDDTKLSDAITSLEECVEKLGKHILAHVSQYWTTERTVQIMGADGSFDAQVYKGASLGGNLDVRVEAGSALPQSKAAKQAFVMDLIKLFPQYADKGLELLEIGGIERIYEEYLTDKRQAQRENIKMAAGEDVEPNDWDNHQVHIDIHNTFRKSQEYESLDDEIKTKFQMHCDLHYVASGQKAAPGMALMPGGMGGGMPGDPAQEGAMAPAGGPPQAPPPGGQPPMPPMPGGPPM